MDLCKKNRPLLKIIRPLLKKPSALKNKIRFFLTCKGCLCGAQIRLRFVSRNNKRFKEKINYFWIKIVRKKN